MKYNYITFFVIFFWMLPCNIESCYEYLHKHTPEFFIKNCRTSDQPGPISLSLYIHVPISDYDKSDSLTYESISKHIMMEPGEVIKIDVDLNNRLSYILIKSQCVNPNTARNIFAKRDTYSVNHIIGERHFSYILSIYDTNVEIERVLNNSPEKLDLLNCCTIS